MPKRIVDGNGIWRSDKLRAVPAWARSEYPWLIPLALANGVFECDPEHIWFDCYAYNRPDVTKDQVVAVLNSFEQAKLLFRWTYNGKTYGFWVGSDKPGRLPGKSRKDGKHDPIGPEVPTNLLAAFLSEGHGIHHTPTDSGNQPDISNGPLGIGLGLGIGIEGLGYGDAAQTPSTTNLGKDDLMAKNRVRKAIEAATLKVFGGRAEWYDNVWEEIDTHVDAFGSQAVITAFEKWAEDHKDDVFPKPVTEFLKTAAQGLAGKTDPVASPEGQDLVSGLVFISDCCIRFRDKEQESICRLLKNWTADDIKAVFREFYSGVENNTFLLQNAAKDFAETAEQMLIFRKRKREEELRTEEAMERQRVEVQEQARRDVEAAKAANQAAEAQETVEDNWLG